MTSGVHHSVLMGLTALAVSFLVLLLWCCLKVSNKPVPRVGWNKEAPDAVVEPVVEPVPEVEIVQP